MAMQLKQPSRLLIFLAVFMLCGQVMGAPLLICRNMVSASAQALPQADQSPAHACAGMMMIPDTGEGETQIMVDNGLATDLDQASFKSMQDCEYLCQFCRGMTSVDASDVVFSVAPLLPRYGDFYTSRFVSAAIEVHFRPPIKA